MASERTLIATQNALQRALDALEAEPNPVKRARFAESLALMCRNASGEFGALRTGALAELREQGWSLSDMSKEFGIARARLSQIINRDDYKEYRREYRKKRRTD
jgi:hypothetical protein